MPCREVGVRVLRGWFDEDDQYRSFYGSRSVMNAFQYGMNRDAKRNRVIFELSTKNGDPRADQESDFGWKMYRSRLDENMLGKRPGVLLMRAFMDEFMF